MEDANRRHRDFCHFGGDPEGKHKEVADDHFIGSAKVFRRREHGLHCRVEAVPHDEFGLPKRIADPDDFPPDFFNPPRWRGVGIRYGDKVVSETGHQPTVIPADVVRDEQCHLVSCTCQPSRQSVERANISLAALRLQTDFHFKDLVANSSVKENALGNDQAAHGRNLGAWLHLIITVKSKLSSFGLTVALPPLNCSP